MRGLHGSYMVTYYTLAVYTNFAVTTNWSQYSTSIRIINFPVLGRHYPLLLAALKTWILITHKVGFEKELFFSALLR